MWLTTKQFREKYNISPQSLYQMKIHNRIKTKPYLTTSYLIYDEDEQINDVAIYCRVSSTSQKKDLENQIDYSRKYLISKGINPKYIFQDIASGMNEKRKGLNELLQLVYNKKIKTIYITHKDRLTRFGFGYLENICNSFGVNIEIINLEDDKSFQEELAEDLISIIHHFNMKFYGHRRNRCKELEEKSILLKNNLDK